MAVVAGEGTIFKCCASDGTSTPSAVAEVVSVSLSMSLAEVETTNLSSSTKTYRYSNLPEGGTCDITLNFDDDDTSQAVIENAITTPANLDCVIQFSDSTSNTRTFTAFPTKFNYSGMQNEQNLQAEVSFRIVGAVTT